MSVICRAGRLVIAVLVSLVAPCTEASNLVYKCKDSGGQVRYRDTPCIKGRTMRYSKYTASMDASARHQAAMQRRFEQDQVRKLAHR